jgi:hypothetical protein
MPYRSFPLRDLQNAVAPYTESTVKETQSGNVLTTTYGARLLGLYPRRDGLNTLWIFEDIEKEMKLQQWLVGGERLWIAPEREFYYENPRDFDGFHVPAGIDPGNYQMLGEMVYENIFSLLNCARNETYDNCLARRTIKLIEDPFQSGLEYAGVEIAEMLMITKPNLNMSAWSIAQVYSSGPEKPGTAFFPVREGAHPLSYFSPIPQDRVSVNGTCARFKIDGEEIYKLGIKPEDMDFDNPVKAVYVSPWPQGDDWFAVIKVSDDMPRTQEECVDIPRGDTSGPKGAIQSYNNGPDFSDEIENAPFGEIELQLNCGLFDTSTTTSTGTHKLLSYAGSKEQILNLAAEALRLDSTPELY